MKRNVIAIAIASLSIAACTTVDRDGAGEAVAENAEPIREKVTVYDQSKKSSNLHCQTYMPTGSHRKITRCVTKKQRKLEEDAARNTLTRMNRGSAADPAMGSPTGP